MTAAAPGRVATAEPAGARHLFGADDITASLAQGVELQDIVRAPRATPIKLRVIRPSIDIGTALRDILGVFARFETNLR